MTPRLLLLPLLAVSLSGCAVLDELLSDDGPSSPDVIYVQESSRPAYFDPYYNEPKIVVVQQPVYIRPETYYESVSKKTKGDRVYKTTTVRNEFGDTVYKHTSSQKKKKKK